MLFKDISHWASAIQTKGLIFFVQRFDELIYEYTLDSYRTPTTNAPFLALECLSIISTAEQFGYGSGSITHLIEELESRLRNNIIVKSLLNVPLKRYLPLPTNDIVELKRRLVLIKQEIAPTTYAMMAMKILKAEIANDKKSNIDFLTQELASTLVNMGVNPSYLKEAIDKTFYRVSRSVDDESLASFFRMIFPHTHKFCAYLFLDSGFDKIPEKAMNALRISLVKDPSSIIPKLDPKFLRGKPSNYRLACVEGISATDKNTASHRAFRSINRMNDLLAVFYHKGRVKYSETVFAIQLCCDKQREMVSIDINLMQHVRDNAIAQATNKLSAMIRNQNLPRGDDKDRFFRSLEFHGIALRSDSPENQLINLWTALETICPIKSGQSVVAGVTSAVLPILGIQYARDLIGNLTFDILRWNRRILSKHLKGIAFPHDYDLFDKVFALITDDRNKAGYDGLMSDFDQFELLRYRVFCLQKLFLTTKKADEKIANHLRKVEWQIHRIYRTRNSIIHSGDVPEGIPSLVVNTHDYFDKTYLMLLDLCDSRQGHYLFKDAFDFGDALYRSYQQSLIDFDASEKPNPRVVLWRKKSTPTPDDFFEVS